MIVVVAAAMKARNPSRNIAQASSGAAIHIAANTTIIVQVTAIHIGPGPRGRGGDPYPGTGG
jgi:hypothetical protein